VGKSISVEAGVKADEDKTTEQEQKLDKNVRCKQCQHEITKPSLAVQPHEHTFRNPGGYSFHVLCYSTAPGAGDIGEQTDEASWFAGYAWSFAVCLQCKQHLGWWYHGKDRFVGLIATRLLR